MKYIKLFEQEYSIYEIITMTPGMASEVLIDEIKKNSPDIELIKNLLDHSLADVNMRTDYESTALMWAARGGNTACVEALVAAKAALDIKDVSYSRLFSCSFTLILCLYATRIMILL